MPRLARPCSNQSPEPPAKQIETTTIRKLVEDAVSASTDVARLLADVLGEIAPIDDATESGPAAVRGSRKRPARRQPMRLPGGVLSGSAEAAEFLLRTAGATTFVDGYNVAKLGWPSLDLAHQREQCIMAAENLAKRWNMTMTIVFDGADRSGRSRRRPDRRVRIVYSPAGVSADDVLRAEVAAAEVAKPVVVVTNDRAIITDVAAAGANTRLLRRVPRPRSAADTPFVHVRDEDQPEPPHTLTAFEVDWAR